MTLQSIEERKVKFDLIVVVFTVDEYLNIFPNIIYGLWLRCHPAGHFPNLAWFGGPEYLQIEGILK